MTTQIRKTTAGYHLLSFLFNQPANSVAIAATPKTLTHIEAMLAEAELIDAGLAAALRELFTTTSAPLYITPTEALTAPLQPQDTMMLQLLRRYHLADRVKLHEKTLLLYTV